MTASPRCRRRGARPPRHGRLWRRGAGRAGISWRDRLLASDPGLNRLRVATHGAVGISASIGAERLLTLETGRPSNASLIAMLLGAAVAMQATLGLAGRTRGTLRVGLGFPVAMSLGLVAGSFVAGRGATPLVVFVVVQFAAVFVRRFGAPFFIYGFMGWMGYFFASLLNASVGELPRLVEDVAVASAVTVLLSMTLLRYRPERVLTRLLAAFDARGRAVAAAAADVLRQSAGGNSARCRPLPIRSRRPCATTSSGSPKRR